MNISEGAYNIIGGLYKNFQATYNTQLRQYKNSIRQLYTKPFSQNNWKNVKTNLKSAVNTLDKMAYKLDLSSQEIMRYARETSNGVGETDTYNRFGGIAKKLELAPKPGLQLIPKPQPTPKPATKTVTEFGVRQAGAGTPGYYKGIVWMGPGGAKSVTYNVALDKSQIADNTAELEITAPAWTKQSEIGGVGTSATAKVEIYNVKTGEWEAHEVESGYAEEGGYNVGKIKLENVSDYMNEKGEMQVRLSRPAGETAHLGATEEGVKVTYAENPDYTRGKEIGLEGEQR